MIRQFQLLILPLFFMAAGISSAQFYLSSADTALLALDTIKVEASRYRKPLKEIPLAVSVVDAKLAGSLKTGFSLEMIMAAVPGLQVDNRSNLAQGDRISIRGVGSRASFGVRGIKIVLDGIPLTMPDGQTQLNNLDLAFVDRVEVIKGPSSSLYGNASGGVILLRSRRADQPGVNYRMGALGGSYNSSRLYGSLGSTLGNGEFTVNASKTGTEGYREHAQAQFSNVNVIGRHGLSKRSEIGIVLNYFNAPYMLNPSSLDKIDSENNPRMARTYVISQGSGKRVEQGQGGISYRFDGEKTHLTSTVYGLFRSLYNAIPGRIIDLGRSAGGVRTVLVQKMSIGLVRGEISIGHDLEWQSDERSEQVNQGIPEKGLPADEILDSLVKGDDLLDQAEYVRSNGTFLQLHLVPSPGMAIMAGIRYDRFRFHVRDRMSGADLSHSGSRMMSHLSPMVGFSYSPRRFLNIYANLSSAFQTPTTTELSNRPSGAGGFNPELEPEELGNVELGVRGFRMSRRIQYSAALYQLNVSGMLIPYQIQSTTSEEIYYRNAGKSCNRGAEIELGWYPDSRFEIMASFTRSDFRFVDYQTESGEGDGGQLRQLGGNRVPGVAPNRFMLFTFYRPFPGFEMGFTARWSDRYYADDLNGMAGGDKSQYVNDAHWVGDLSMKYATNLFGSRVNVILNISNVFDTRYNGSIVPNAFKRRYFEPAAGRSYMGGIEVLLGRP